ncbi:MAG: sugar nucleotide-binding protein, partial [Muribaculaceae bacterium]|nr:sugar nucleotide-binding protein [Muribaculaceae bacterium]
MKFLILGCNGMAGHIISLYLKEQGHEVTGFARSKSPFVPTIIGDATNTELLAGAIAAGKYDAVINAIGLLNQFAENNHAAAVFLNGYLPHYLAEITDGTDTQVIQMSTDCVFSGKDGQYTETSLPDGATFYDRSKAMGELNDSKNLTLRNSIVGPDIKPGGIGLLNWFMQQQGPMVNGFTGAIWTGQTTLQLAKTMEAAARQRAHGLVNAVPSEPITKYELLCLFNKYLRDGKLTVNPIAGVTADKSLVRTNYDFDYTIPGYEEMVSDMSA